MARRMYKHTIEHNKNIGKALRGRKLPEETKRKMSEAHKKNPSRYWEGKHRTELTKEKISKSLKGIIPWNSGKHLTILQRRKTSKSLKNYWNTEEGKERKKNRMLKGKKHPLFGKPRSQETKEKIRKAHVGKKQTEEARNKKSKALKGRISPMKGRHHSEETKKKMREKRLGRKMSEESKGKISKANKGRKFTQNQIKSFLTRRIPSSLEKKFQTIVDKYNLSYKYVGNGDFILGGKNPDFINTNNEKIAIEVYAKYFKNKGVKTVENWKEERIKIFKKYGWELIFFDETEVNEKFVLNIL